MIMKEFENYKYFNMVIAIILLFTCPLAINYSITFLPIILTNAFSICSIILSIISLLRIINISTLNNHTVALFITFSVCTLIISITSIIHPTDHIIMNIILWILLFIEIIITTLLFCGIYGIGFPNNPNIINTESYGLSYNFLREVALTQITFYLIIANYFFNFLPNYFVGLLETCSMIIPGTYIFHSIFSPMRLGWKKREDGKKYFSSNILTWMFIINLMLAFNGYIVMLFLDPESNFVQIFYIISLAINGIFTTQLISGIFQE